MPIKMSPGWHAHGDQLVAETSRRIDEILATYRRALAEGEDRNVCIAAIGLGFGEAESKDEIQGAAATLAVALARLAEAEDELAAPRGER